MSTNRTWRDRAGLTGNYVRPHSKYQGKKAPAVERFWRYVEKSDGCWLWQGPLSRAGYGAIRRDDKTWTGVHRFAYELLVGPIPEGLTLDHLCRNPRCVNPDHLEPVTMRENLMRGHGPSARASKRTHCPQGHPYDEANTYRDGRGRRCRACHRDRQARRYHAMKMQVR